MAEWREDERLIHGDYVLFDGAEVMLYSELTDRYALSVYGSHHATQPPRFHQHYAYHFPSMITDLGDDIHPVKHMGYTEESIVQPFIEAQNQSAGYYDPFHPAAITSMRVGARLHDIGECEHPVIKEQVGYTVGDLSEETRSASDLDKELPVRQILYDELYRDLPSDLLLLAEELIAKSQGNSASEAFDAVERIGYFITAMRAGNLALRLAKQEAKKPSLRYLQLSRLAVRVSSRHHDALESQAENYAYAGKILERHGRLHEEIHKKLVAVPDEEVPQAA